MLFDPEIRQAKYAALRDVALSHGLQAEILIGEAEPDALAVWSVSPVSGAGRPQGRFWLHCRQRGWFLGVSGLKRYLIPNRDVVAPVTLEVAAATRVGQGDESLARVVREFMLAPVEQTTWHREEGEEQRLAWEEYGWFVLPQGEEIQVWGRFSERLLGPGGDLNSPVPALTWVIRDLSGDRLDASHDAEGLLTLAVFEALKGCTPEGQHVLALDWDHPCYRFLPHQGVRKPYRDYWAVPVWPRGGSYYFVAPGFEYGVLASHAGKLHIFGQALANASHVAVTKLLGPPGS